MPPETSESQSIPEEQLQAEPVGGVENVEQLIDPKYWEERFEAEWQEKAGKEKNWLKDLDNGKITFKDYSDKVKRLMESQFMQERAQEIVIQMREVYRDKPEMLVPVYDIYGNLYWPKEMSYEDVKKFVAERDRQKKEETGNQNEN